MLIFWRSSNPKDVFRGAVHPASTLFLQFNFRTRVQRFSKLETNHDQQHPFQENRKPRRRLEKAFGYAQAVQVKDTQSIFLDS